MIFIKAIPIIDKQRGIFLAEMQQILKSGKFVIKNSRKFNGELLKSEQKKEYVPKYHRKYG